MLPDTRDIAALPTSWALTIWDALPVFLSVEVATVIFAAMLLGPVGMRRFGAFSAALPAGSVAYLFLFNSWLALVVAVAAVSHASAILRLTGTGETFAAPQSPWEAMRQHGGEVLWSVVKASAAAALIKVILAPSIAPGSALWFPIGVVGGVLNPGPIGVAAIPALATQSTSDSILPAAVWITVTAVRPHIVRHIRPLVTSSAPATDAP